MTKKLIRMVSIYSVIYTAITLLSSVLYLCDGVYEDPSGNWHELDRAMILLIGIVAFELCTKLPVKPLILRYVTAYIPSLLLAFAYVWSTGLRVPLAKTAYRDIWINFTSLFVLLSIINTAVCAYKRVVSESYCTEKKIADSVYQIWRKSGQRNSVPDIVAEFINRGHDFKTSLMAGF